MAYIECVWSGFTIFYFFFFKQKTAYEMLRSLVGSEMCIRDRFQDAFDVGLVVKVVVEGAGGVGCLALAAQFAVAAIGE